MKKVVCTILLLGLLAAATGCNPQRPEEEDVCYKPVIYLYPEETLEVSVTLDYSGTLTCTYPAYHQGWRVIAQPDGTLTNVSDGKPYSYLFWEGIADVCYDMSKGLGKRGGYRCISSGYLAPAGPDPQRIQRIYRILAAQDAG